MPALPSKFELNPSRKLIHHNLSKTSPTWQVSDSSNKNEAPKRHCRTYCAHVDIVEHCVSPPQHPRPLAANRVSLLCSSLPDFGARESSNHQSAQCGSARFQFRTWQHMSGRLPPLPLHYPLTPIPLSRPPWLISHPLSLS